jgi:hypothetical protein
MSLLCVFAVLVCAASPPGGYTSGMTREDRAAPGEYLLPFPDRQAAGRLLAERLNRTGVLHDWAERAVVLGLPRGGVAVAKQVAVVLGLPMDVIVTRKIGYPRQPELGVGAIAEGLGSPVYDADLLDRLSLSPADLAPVVAAEQAELARRVLVQATPGAVLLRPRYRVVQTLKPHRAVSADLLGLALPDLPLRLALTVRTEEEQQVLTTARGSILPPPVRAGKHSRLPTYLRHGSITSTKMHQIVRYSRSSGS